MNSRYQILLHWHCLGTKLPNWHTFAYRALLTLHEVRYKIVPYQQTFWVQKSSKMTSRTSWCVAGKKRLCQGGFSLSTLVSRARRSGYHSCMATREPLGSSWGSEKSLLSWWLDGSSKSGERCKCPGCPKGVAGHLLPRPRDLERLNKMLLVFCCIWLQRPTVGLPHRWISLSTTSRWSNHSIPITWKTRTPSCKMGRKC